MTDVLAVIVTNSNIKLASYSRQQLENWLKTLEVKVDSLIDVGGSQNPVKGRTKSWEVKDYKILDLKQPHECKQKPDYTWDLNDEAREAWPKEMADMIFCLEVSEYWWNPFQALKNIHHFLKSNGKLYISFHFLYPLHEPKEQDYLRYTKFGVKKLLEESGFRIEKIIPRKTQKLSPMTLYNAEQMRPSKTYNDHAEIGFLIECIKI